MLPKMSKVFQLLERLESLVTSRKSSGPKHTRLGAASSSTKTANGTRGCTLATTESVATWGKLPFTSRGNPAANAHQIPHARTPYVLGHREYRTPYILDSFDMSETEYL